MKLKMEERRIRYNMAFKSVVNLIETHEEGLRISAAHFAMLLRILQEEHERTMPPPIRKPSLHLVTEED